MQLSWLYNSSTLPWINLSTTLQTFKDISNGWRTETLMYITITWYRSRNIEGDIQLYIQQNIKAKFIASTYHFSCYYTLDYYLNWGKFSSLYIHELQWKELPQKQTHEMFDTDATRLAHKRCIVCRTTCTTLMLLIIELLVIENETLKQFPPIFVLKGKRGRNLCNTQS